MREEAHIKCDTAAASGKRTEEEERREWRALGQSFVVNVAGWAGDGEPSGVNAGEV